MTDENASGNGRKKARAKQPKKRAEDVLDDEQSETSDQNVRKTPDKSATIRGESGDESTGDNKRSRRADSEKPGSDEGGSDDKSSSSKPEKTEQTEKVDAATRGETWLAGLFERMKLDLEASGSHDKENQQYVFDISGPDSDDLISRSRQSPRLVSAIQTLLTEHLGRDYRGDVVVDIGGFKQKRKSRLVGVADKLADKARQLDKSLTVAGFNRYERRIIHRHLDNIDGVDTDSVGDGIFRKIRILVD